MPFEPAVPVLSPVTATTWLLVEPLVYHGETESWSIPAGYTTDMASSPELVEWHIRRYGAYLNACLVHDYLITDELTKEPPSITSRDVDGVFRRIMKEEGVPFLMRWTIWAGVRAAAPFNPNRRYGLGLRKDLPKMLLVAIPAIRLLPGIIGVGISRILTLPDRKIGARRATLAQLSRVKRLPVQGDPTTDRRGRIRSVHPRRSSHARLLRAILWTFLGVVLLLLAIHLGVQNLWPST
jgi:hypothetical protein